VHFLSHTFKTKNYHLIFTSKFIFLLYIFIILIIMMCYNINQTDHLPHPCMTKLYPGYAVAYNHLVVKVKITDYRENKENVGIAG